MNVPGFSDFLHPPDIFVDHASVQQCLSSEMHLYLRQIKEEPSHNYHKCLNYLDYLHAARVYMTRQSFIRKASSRNICSWANILTRTVLAFCLFVCFFTEESFPDEGPSQVVYERTLSYPVCRSGGEEGLLKSPWIWGEMKPGVGYSMPSYTFESLLQCCALRQM